MPLFIWNSETTRNYGLGEIVVSADDIEAARALVRAGVDELRQAVKNDARAVSYAAYDNSYVLAYHIAPHIPLDYGDGLDPDDVATFENKLALVESDIAAEPKTVSVAFIRGSD